MEAKTPQKLYFDLPKLHMTIFGRFVVRLATYAVYGALGVVFFIFISSDLRNLRSLGILLGLFLIDRLLSVRRGERSLDYVAKKKKKKLNVAKFLSPSSVKLLEKTLDQSLMRKEDFFLYMLGNLLTRADMQRALLRIDVNHEELMRKLQDYMEKYSEQTLEKKELVENIEKIVVRAFHAAQSASSHYIEPRDLFVGLAFIEYPKIKKILNLFDIDAEEIEYALVFSRHHYGAFAKLKKMPLSMVGFIGKKFRVRHRIMNRAWTARPTRILDQFSADITDLARNEQVGFLIGHVNEYDRLTDVLSRAGNPNAVLIGEPGSGKDSVVAHMAFNIVRDQVPPELFDKRLVMLEIGSLVAGAAEGDLQERVKEMINDIISAGNVVLYIPDLHNLVRTSGEKTLSAADILLPAVKSSAFSVVGATTPADYKKYIESNSDLAASFEPIMVEEVTEKEATRFLIYEALFLEERFGVVIGLEAIKTAVNLAKKYFHKKLLPASASDLLKETLADVSEKGKTTLSAHDVIYVAEKRTNVPIHTVGKEEAEKLLRLEDIIHKKMVNQDEAVKAVSRALREYRSGLSKPGRPIATFLFVGPTGVGKTQLSKIVTEIQFGSEKFMTRFDMSEYQTKESIFQLIGSPKGEVRGSLTEAVRENPYTLLLLDEFEKAHPDLLNLFLQVFDDGRLTDNLGRTIDFQNTIIIATSNAHSEFIQEEIEKGIKISTVSEVLKKKLSDYFKPELLNRFSDIIVFQSLSPKHVEEIAGLLLHELAEFLEEEKGLTVHFDKSAIKKVAELGYEPAFGARPLRKTISETIRGALAKKILKGEISRGGSVRVVFSENEFHFLPVETNE